MPSGPKTMTKDSQIRKIINFTSALPKPLSAQADKALFWMQEPAPACAAKL